MAARIAPRAAQRDDAGEPNAVPASSSVASMIHPARLPSLVLNKQQPLDRSPALQQQQHSAVENLVLAIEGGIVVELTQRAEAGLHCCQCYCYYCHSQHPQAVDDAPRRSGTATPLRCSSRLRAPCRARRRTPGPARPAAAAPSQNRRRPPRAGAGERRRSCRLLERRQQPPQAQLPRGDGDGDGPRSSRSGGPRA